MYREVHRVHIGDSTCLSSELLFSNLLTHSLLPLRDEKKKHITHGKTSCHHSGYVGCGAQSKSDFDKQIDQHLEAVIASW